MKKKEKSLDFKQKVKGKQKGIEHKSNLPKEINYRAKTHKGWINITIDLSKFMNYFKKLSPLWYVKKGNKNEVEGRIDKF